MDCGSSSSTSSESSTSSLSSSASSSGTECSSIEERRANVKSQTTMNTRRKSSEVKNFEKQMNATVNTKRQSNSTTSVNRVLRKNQLSSDEESPSSKKLTNDSTTLQRRKLSTSTPTNRNQQLTQNANELNSKICQLNNKQSKGRVVSKKTIEENYEKEKKIVTKRSKIKTDILKNNSNKLETKKKKVTKDKQIIAKENFPAKSIASSKCFGESGSASESDSENGSTTTSDSEATASSNSFTSTAGKTQKCKKDGGNNKLIQVESEDDNAPRKLTRSLSTRVTKQPKREISASETSTDAEDEKCIESSIKKTSNSVIAKKKWKKDKISSNAVGCTFQQSCMSPPCQQEKKCPIEGCDSSGHLSGLLERHFLQEACPTYHNMSASECKEAANERKLQNEKLIKKEKDLTHCNSIQMNKQLTEEHKEYLAKINDSRSKFKPLTSSLNDKVKLEKDCADEDREPNIIGFVPEYDLQLFREAQAIASQKIENEVKDLQVGKGIKYITMGKYKMKVWYQSPYPEDAARLPQMYICEFCLRYQKSETSIKRHAQKCVWRHPPGDEIYRKGKLQVWQVDGKRHKQYCQHLCLLAKFFLDHKTLYYDVEPFLFYIMTLADIDGCHTVGYFSKEKNSFYNVSCILTLPPYQRKGYGRLLIDFSYLLTRVEGKIGSPEKPLSDLGLISYRSYWKDVLLDFLCNRSDNTLSIKDVSQEMAIYSYDIVSTLQALGMMKYWKGKHIVLKKQDVLDEYAERVKRRGSFPKIDESCLRWNPFVQSHSSDSP